MAGIELTVQGQRDVLARVNSLVQFDPTELLDDVGQYLVSETVYRFRTSTDPQGNQWQPLSERTREQRGQQAKPLVHKGHLRDSITHQVRGDEVRIGNNRIYGAIHQFGGQAGRGHKVPLPARPYLGINGDDEVEITQIAQGHVNRALALGNG